MIVTEYYVTRSDGVVLNRTYSDRGFMIQREGVLYAEAIDPAELNRVYQETDMAIDTGETEQKAAAYDILMGGMT